MIRAALRRFLGLLALLSGLSIGLSLVFGLSAGASASRSVSVGFYIVGSVVMLVGFFVGNRGPVRTKGDPGDPLFGPLLQTRRLRWASVEEREESLNISVILVVLGFVLILFGVISDTRYALY